MTKEFSPRLLEAWCNIYRVAVLNHPRRLTNLLRQKTSRGRVAHFLANAVSNEDLISLSEKVDEGQAPSDENLIHAYCALREFENRYPVSIVRRLTGGKPRTVEIHNHRYLLLTPGINPILTAMPRKDRFKAPDEIGLSPELRLRIRWQPLAAEIRLDWTVSSILEEIRYLSAVRIGISPLATAEEMTWTVHDDSPRAPDNRVPLQCRGAQDEEALWQRIQSVLESAHRAEVHILLFPELSISAALLERMRIWLKEHNTATPRLHLVLAGTRHVAAEGEGLKYHNRCTILDHGGEIAWEQDKRTPFSLDNAAWLAQIKPGCTASRAFEPTELSNVIAVRETALGRVLAPICLDFIDDTVWSEIGANLYLVPAMSPGLARFHNRAQDLGGRHSAATFVCNAVMAGERRNRYVVYLPSRQEPTITARRNQLFIADVPIRMK